MSGLQDYVDPAIQAQLDALQRRLKAEEQAIQRIAAEQNAKIIQECASCGTHCDSRTLTCGECAIPLERDDDDDDRHPLSDRRRASLDGIHPEVAAVPGMTKPIPGSTIGAVLDNCVSGMTKPIPGSGTGVVLDNWVSVPGSPGKFRHISAIPGHANYAKTWDPTDTLVPVPYFLPR